MYHPDMTMSRNQLRAARMLLGLSQEELAGIAEIGVATIRRYETGHDIGSALVDKLRAAVQTAGVVLIHGVDVEGQTVGDGVALLPEPKLPRETKNKVQRLDQPTVSIEPRSPGRPKKAAKTPRGSKG